MLSTSVRDDASIRAQDAKEAWARENASHAVGKRGKEWEVKAMEAILRAIEVMDLEEAIGLDGYTIEALRDWAMERLQASVEEIEAEKENDGLIFAAFSWGNWTEVWDDTSIEHEPVLGIDLGAHPRMSPYHRRECMKCWPQLEQLMGNQQEFLIGLYNSPHVGKYPHLKYLMENAIRMQGQMVFVNEYVTVGNKEIDNGLAEPGDRGKRLRLGPSRKMGAFQALMEDLDVHHRQLLWEKKQAMEAKVEGFVNDSDVDIDSPRPSDLVARAMRAFVLRSKPKNPICTVCERRKALKQAMRPFRKGSEHAPPRERHDVLVRMLYSEDRDTPVTRGKWMDEEAVQYTAYEDDQQSLAREVGRDDKYRPIMAVEIEAPAFGKKMRDALLNGTKYMTSRYVPFGKAGDWFKIGGRRFVITYVEPKLLREVVKNYYKMEGFETPQDFLAYWIDIHGDMVKTRKEAMAIRQKGRKAFSPDDTVYVHTLMEPWNSSPIREFTTPVLKQDEFITSGLGEEIWELAKCASFGREYQQYKEDILNRLTMKVDEVMDWNQFVKQQSTIEEDLHRLDRDFDRAINRAHRDRAIGEDRVFLARMEAERNKERDLVLEVARRTPWTIRDGQRIELA